MNETWIRSGALLRRSVRRELMKAGYVFREEKGLLDSLFVITYNTPEERAVLVNWMLRLNANA